MAITTKLESLILTKQGMLSMVLMEFKKSYDNYWLFDMNKISFENREKSS